MDSTGGWEIAPGDVVVVADEDEIPTEEALIALRECAPPNFEPARSGDSCGNDSKHRGLGCCCRQPVIFTPIWTGSHKVRLQSWDNWLSP